MRRLKCISAAIALSLAIFAGTFPAQATHGGRGVGHPDNMYQAVSHQGLTSLGAYAANWGSARLNQSELVMSSGSGDIYVYDHDYGGTWLGDARCDLSNWWNGWCDVYKIRLNSSNLGWNQAYWNSTACQEFGHTGHLGHRYSWTDSDNNSCMREDIDPTYLDWHDLDAMNALSY